MDLQAATIEKVCSQNDISAYVDGELSPQHELALEAHLAGCKNCLAELNLQKQMLFALDCGLDEEPEIELPKNFAKVVAVRAESGVCGLRSKEERFRALFLCVFLFLIAIIGLGAETGNVLATLEKFLEKILAFVSFLGHLFYDLAIGIIIILRSLSHLFYSGSVVPLFFVLGLFTFAAVVVSRRRRGVSQLRRS